MGRYFLAWFPMVLIAVANGAFREAYLLPRLGDHSARQVSTLLLIVLFAIYIGLVVRTWPPASGGQALGVGVMWLVLTVTFEFAAAGRLWALVPIWVGIAPYVFFRVWRGP